MVLKKTLESSLDCKDIKSINPKGNQPWIIIGKTDAEAEAEASILWPKKKKKKYFDHLTQTANSLEKKRVYVYVYVNIYIKYIIMKDSYCKTETNTTL